MRQIMLNLRNYFQEVKARRKIARIATDWWGKSTFLATKRKHGETVAKRGLGRFKRKLFTRINRELKCHEQLNITIIHEQLCPLLAEEVSNAGFKGSFYYEMYMWIDISQDIITGRVVDTAERKFLGRRRTHTFSIHPSLVH